ncbi:hypothetical protein CP01DC11_1276 [Chlamydia psittaci 01DC11]|nr:hypothetical protein CP01DC11_1276 [Chlamydia psittaci 01DC11]
MLNCKFKGAVLSFCRGFSRLFSAAGEVDQSQLIRVFSC